MSFKAPWPAVPEDAPQSLAQHNFSRHRAYTSKSPFASFKSIKSQSSRSVSSVEVADREDPPDVRPLHRSSALHAEKPSHQPGRPGWKVVRAATNIMGAMEHVRTSANLARRHRAQRNWTLVRHIARAAQSAAYLSGIVHTADTKFGISNFSRFVRVLGLHPAARTTRDLDFLVGATLHIAFFTDAQRTASGARITPAQHREACRVMTMERVDKIGGSITTQGERGDTFYILLDGRVTVRVHSGPRGFPRAVASLGVGEGFGDSALRSEDGLRTASVTADVPCTFLVLQAADYRRVLMDSHMEAIEDRMRFLATVPALRDLSSRDLFGLALVLQSRNANPGHALVREGDAISNLTFLLLIKRGEAEVHQTNHRVCLLGPADFTANWRITNNLSSGPACLPPPASAPSRQTLSPAAIGAADSALEAAGREEDSQPCWQYSVVATTLLNYYVISKHDLLGLRVGAHVLRRIRAHVIRVPDPSEMRSRRAAEARWQGYKAKLLHEISPRQFPLAPSPPAPRRGNALPRQNMQRARRAKGALGESPQLKQLRAATRSPTSARTATVVNC